MSEMLRPIQRLAIGRVSLSFVLSLLACQPHLMHRALLSLMLLSTVIRPCSVYTCVHVQRGWDDTHISPRSCPSAGAKLCTYHRWFSRPNPQVTEPYFELPLSRRSLGQLFRFRLSSHSLPIEQGRRAKLPRAMRFCPFCPGHHVGDERHLVFECPALQHIRQHYADIYSDARSRMRLFMWHKDQKAVASCLLSLLSQYDSLLG